MIPGIVLVLALVVLASPLCTTSVEVGNFHLMLLPDDLIIGSTVSKPDFSTLISSPSIPYGVDVLGTKLYTTPKGIKDTLPLLITVLL